MKFEEVEDKIYDVISVLTSLPVCWVMDNGPRPAQPYIALRLDSDESILVETRATLGSLTGKTDLYCSMALLQVNLIGSTKGALEAFGKKINTTAAAVLFDGQEIGAFANARARDLSEIPSDSTKWERRHVLDCDISFLEHIDDVTTPQITQINFKVSNGKFDILYTVEETETFRTITFDQPLQTEDHHLVTWHKNGFNITPIIGTDVVLTKFTATFNASIFDIDDVVGFTYISNPD